MFNIGRRTASLSAATVLTGALLAGCADETPIQEAEEEGPAATAAVLGETVTIEAEVQDVVGPHAFTVGEDDTLILSATEPTVDVGDEVAASGVVRQLMIADFERDYDWFDFGDEDWTAEYERDLVLVADTVETVDQ